jgi:hypothetical protein
MHNTARASVLGVALLLLVDAAAGQELEPRALSRAPIGTKFLGTGVGVTTGAVDPAGPISNVEAEISHALIGGGYTFDIGGHQALVVAVLPYAGGGVAGTVGGEDRSRKLEGLLDPRIKLSVGLVGAPSLTPEEFARAPRETVIGASITVMPPLGTYNPERLVNLGYNRWAIKPEIGISHPVGPWTFETSAGVWLFAANTAYFPGRSERKQNPIFSLQGHVSREFDNGAWLALSATWFTGGQTEVDGTKRPDRQNNTRLGATLSLPMSRLQSIKFTYNSNLASRGGFDSDTLSVTWQLVMF